MGNIWNATESELKAADEIKNKLFSMVNEFNESLNERGLVHTMKS